MNESIKDRQGESAGAGAAPHAAGGLLWVGLGILVGCIVLTRTPFFTSYFLPGISPDTWSFLLPVVDMLDGRRPLFAVRLPGYPIFVLLSTSIHRAWEPLLFAQAAATLAASSLMVYAAHRARPWLAIPVAAAMMLVLVSDTYLRFETSVVSESLYMCTMIGGFGCLLIGLREHRSGWLMVTSLLFAYTICVRPAGMFLIVIVIAAWLFMWWNRYRKAAQLAFVLPMTAMLLVLATYNSFTMGVFALSPVGSRNIAAATAMFWEQDPEFAADTNTAIERMRASVSKEDLSLLSDSWDLKSLHRLFRTNYGFTKHVRKLAFGEWFDKRPGGMATYIEFYEILPHVALKAIRSHPELYSKFVVANLYAYFWVNPLVTDDFWGARLPRRLQEWSTAQLANEAFVEQFVDHRSSERWQQRRIGDSAQGYTLRPSLGLAWATFVARVHRKISSTRVWVVAYLLVALASFAHVVLTKARDPDSVFVLLLCAAGFGAALLVCLVEPALIRYSRTTEFIIYLSAAFSPLLLGQSNKRHREAIPCSQQH